MLYRSFWWLFGGRFEEVKNGHKVIVIAIVKMIRDGEKRNL